MSWDIELIKTKTNTEPMEDIDDSITVPIESALAAAMLREKYPSIQGDSDEWLDYETEGYSVSIDLSSNGIMLYVHILEEPEDAVLEFVAELCDLFECRAFDTTSAEFLFEEPKSAPCMDGERKSPSKVGFWASLKRKFGIFNTRK